MGRIVAQLKLTNFTDRHKTLSVSALVDTGAAYITLPNAWRDALGEIEQLAEIEVELGDQSAVDLLGHRLVHVKDVDLK